MYLCQRIKSVNMRAILQWIALCAVLVHHVYCSLLETHTLNAGLYIRIPNLFIDHVIGSLNVRDVSQCCAQCSLNISCEAVNFYPTESVCELNDKNPDDYAEFINKTASPNSSVLFLRRKPCDPGWYQFDRHCYYFVSTLMTWTDSRDNCISMGADLVEITSVEENTYIFNVSSNLYFYDVWIGLNDLSVEGTFVWPSREPLVYHNFREGDPDSYYADENCVGAHSENYWNDKQCHIKIESVCEKPRY